MPARSVAALAPGDLRVVVTPPAYVRREPVTAANPTSVTALEGSRVRLEVGSAQRPPVLLGPDGDRVAFEASPGVFVQELTAADSMALIVRQDGDSEGESARRSPVVPRGAAGRASGRDDRRAGEGPAVRRRQRHRSNRDRGAGRSVPWCAGRCTSRG